MKSIVLIIPYFGKWPIWFEAHLISISKNESINWLILTDCEIPNKYPKNIHFINTTLVDLNKKIDEVFGFPIPLSTRKLCDIKPAFGLIFSEYIKDYDFWGFCDLDIVWGDIRKFISDEILTEFDIISSRKEAISGHFTLFRNENGLCNIFKEIPQYQYLFQQPKFKWIDEQELTKYIKSKISDNKFEYKVYWPTILLNQEKGIDSKQEYYLDKWQWQDGQMIELNSNNSTSEVMYLHFINWKKTIKKCEVRYNLNEKKFYVSYSGIHYTKHSSLEILFNDFKNLFDGFYVRLRKRKYLKKITKFKKKILKFNFKK